MGNQMQCRKPRFNPWVRKIPCRRTWQPTLVLLPRESHGQRSLAGCSPQDHKESDRTEATKQQHVALWAVCYVLLAYDFNLQLRGKTVHKYDDDGDGFSDTHWAYAMTQGPNWALHVLTHLIFTTILWGNTIDPKKEESHRLKRQVCVCMSVHVYECVNHKLALAIYLFKD